PEINPIELFALKIRGESMSKAGIFDGDIVIVHKTTYAENGDIVVALVNHEEATVKRFFKEKNKFRLQPENDTMEAIILDEVEILGKVIGLKRHY
ncbi:MAG: transcriptional repressor LexA, partial [Ruminococcus sp.]|nr:transcriptional repressor LexA [Ruminococcus sp.]